MPKEHIERAAAARQARVDRGEDVIVGVNKYLNPNDAPIDILDIDNARVRADQIKRIAKTRAERDAAKAEEALGNLRRGAMASENLLALCVEAARARCTLGEMSAAMEVAFGRHAVGVTPIKGVYGPAHAQDAGWLRAEEGVAAFERRQGRKPRVLVAKMGQDGHDRGANVVASAFADLGFDVVSGPLFQTPAETCALAIERQVDVVGASSLAAGHKTLIPELVAALKEAGRADIKVVAGGVIPPQDYEFLRAHGVQAIFGPGTNLVSAASEVLKLLGHNLPPIEEAAE
jgi:methylmalonyl-CoA mutase